MARSSRRQLPTVATIPHSPAPARWATFGRNTAAATAIPEISGATLAARRWMLRATGGLPQGEVADDAARGSDQGLGGDGEVGRRRAGRGPQLVELEEILVDEDPQRLAVAKRGDGADREAGGVADGLGVLPPGVLA